MDVLLIDNRDSFTFNLAQAWSGMGADVVVEDALTLRAADVLQRRPRLVCVGPGPRGPADLPQLLDLVGGLLDRVPFFGVCLGLQVLVRATGGTVARAAAPVHGKRSPVEHDGSGVLAGLPSPLWVMRYHSLVATQVPPRFSVTAQDGLGQVMALRDPHPRGAPVEAVQFHPESIGTAGGLQVLWRALALGGVDVPEPRERQGAMPPPTAQGPHHRWHQAHPPSRYGAAGLPSEAGSVPLRTDATDPFEEFS